METSLTTSKGDTKTMNIFYLSASPQEAAEMHNDKHCVKMILESAQMLCTAHRVIDGDIKCDTNFMYKEAHKNHPSTKWARENVYQYRWLFDLFESLCDEYTYRYGKLHATDLRLRETLRTPPNALAGLGEFEEPPQCMPDEYKSENTIEAYRNYYLGEKSHFSSWKNRPTPTWYTK